MKKVLHCILFLLLFQFGFSQQVMLQGWYWDFPKTANGYSWTDTLAILAPDLAESGFTHVWIPPHSIAASGQYSNGYDPQDLFIGNQTSGLGTRASLDNMFSTLTAEGIDPVCDLVYNHRDGGRPETNPPVKDYITNYFDDPLTENPFPSDRFRCILPIGGSTGNVAGDYYFKISSKTQNYSGHQYKVYMTTGKNMNDPFGGTFSESEPNGGGDCSQPNNSILLNSDMIASVEEYSGCWTDEFHLALNADDFNAAGDTLFIYMSNHMSGYSDHRIYGIWCAPRSADIAGEILYQTFTDFSNLPSSRGDMYYECFRPNTGNVASETLKGDENEMFFFYDYDQYSNCTRDTLFEWTAWNWEEFGMRGMRLDAVKHFPASFVGDMLDDMHGRGYDPSLIVGEFFSSTTGELSNWLNLVMANMDASTLAAIKPKVFDFSLRENLRRACDDPSFDARYTFQGSLHDVEGTSGYNIVTFVNNHDFRDPSGFNSLVQDDPILAYAYILTNNQLGVPCVFYSDYYAPGPASPPANSGGIPLSLSEVSTKEAIDTLIKLHQQFILGATSVTYLNVIGTPYPGTFNSGSSDKTLIYQISGTPTDKEVVIAINFSDEELQVEQTVSNLLEGDTLSDYLGYSASPFEVVNSSGQVLLDIPPRSYSLWVEGKAPFLPIDFLTLNTSCLNNKINIDWTFADAQNVSHFEVFRSDNGKDFEFVESVNWDGLKPYSIQDNVSGSPSDGYYYFVNAIDHDGSEIRTHISYVRNCMNGAPFIYPNPVNRKLTIHNSQNGVTWEILTIGGIRVLSFETIENKNETEIDLPGVDPGMYILRNSKGFSSLFTVQ